MFDPIFDSEWLLEKLAKEIEEDRELYPCITACGIFFESCMKDVLENAEPDSSGDPSQEEQFTDECLVTK